MEQHKASTIFVNILLIFIFLVGMAILLYPNISDFINRRHSSSAINKYDEELEKLEKEKRELIVSAAEEYNYKLLQTTGRFTVTSESHEKYMSELDINGSGMMGYLKIPKLGLDIPINHTTDETVLQNSVGHVEGTSLPVGGKGSHSALSAHTGLPSAVLFSNLDQMKEGDTFSVFIMGDEHIYQVDKISVVLPSDTSELYIDPGEDWITLITCTPYGVNTHRLLVRGTRITKQQAEERVEEQEPMKVTREQLVNAIAVLFALVFCGLIFFLLPAQVQKLGLRPWDDTIVDTIDGAIMVSENANRENWEVQKIAIHADWLANLRRWQDDILSEEPISDFAFENTDIRKSSLFDVESDGKDLDGLDGDTGYPNGVSNRFSINGVLHNARPFDESMWYEQDEEKRNWNDKILQKVTQDWEQINAKLYREAKEYIDLEDVIAKEKKVNKKL